MVAGSTPAARYRGLVQFQEISERGVVPKSFLSVAGLSYSGNNSIWQSTPFGAALLQVRILLA